MKAKIDSYEVKQYIGKRVVSEVEILEDIGKKKWVLCYVIALQANCLVKVSDLIHPIEQA
jgi:hypothetical protein